MPQDNTTKSGARDIPRGLKLRHTLKGHADTITRIAWSAARLLLATARASTKETGVA